MKASFAIYLLPIAILVACAYMAVHTGNPGWLVFGAVAAIVTGFMARHF